ncbi:MAG TPA: tetratricopeptide repeat protein [Acidisarcina sp.]
MTRSCRAHLAAAILACVAQICGGQGTAPQDPYLQQLGAAKLEAGRGDVSAAKGDIESVISLDPSRSAGWYQLGVLLGQTGDFHGAESALQRAVQLQPDLAPAHFSLALTAIANPQEKADWAEALAQCREALKYQPDYPEALNLLGVGLLKSGLTDDAIASFRAAIKLSPSLAEAHFNLGMALESAEQLKDAELEYRAAIAARGTYPEAASWLSKLLFREGKPVAAEREALIALRANPDLTEAHYTLARILRSLHRDEEAKWEFREFEDLTQRKTNSIQSANLSNQGLELARKGDTPGAVASLKKAIAMCPDYGVAHYNLGLVLADSGDTSHAVLELKKAVSLIPSEGRTWFNLGRALQLTGNYSDALSAMSWAAHLAPSDAAISAALKSLRTARREAATGRAVSDGPQLSIPRPHVGAATDTAKGHLLFARELNSTGDFEGAAGELLRSLSLGPGMTEARHALACAYLHNGDEDHAMLEYYKLLRYGPGRPESRVTPRGLYLWCLRNSRMNRREQPQVFRLCWA